MKKFCDNCLKIVECNYNEKDTTIDIDNKSITYLKKYYICDECGSEFLDDLYDYDIETVNDKLRELENIITTSEIKEISNKYNIGKKPLSLILGMGEVNIIRYLNGYNPTKEISDLLKNVLNNPFLFELYLMVNKDKISEIAYKKSLSKTKQLEFVNEKSKLYDTSLYIIYKLGEIDHLSLQKLLFFIHGFSNEFLGRNLFDDLPEAWIHGPVYREIYNCFSYYKGNKINYEDLLKSREYNLSNDEKKYIDVLIEDFGCYSGSLLREMTHLTTPWINARKNLDDSSYSNRVIEKNDINNYFKEIYDKYNMKSVEDIVKYSNDMFKKTRGIFIKD